MNKTELVSKVAEKLGVTKKDTGAAIDAAVDAIIEAVASGDEVSISGFGKFSITERSERQGRNPQTGEAITIAATKSPRFKAAKTFKDAVNA